MAEAIGVAASISGLVTVTFKICNVLSAMSDAPSLAREVHAEVTACNIVFKTFDSFLQEAIGRSDKMFLNVEDFVILLTGCVSTFAELEQTLDELRSGKAKEGEQEISLLDRLKWVAKEDHILKLLMALQNHKSSLNLFLTVYNCRQRYEAPAQLARLNSVFEDRLKQFLALADAETASKVDEKARQYYEAQAQLARLNSLFEDRLKQFLALADAETASKVDEKARQYYEAQAQLAKLNSLLDRLNRILAQTMANSETASEVDAEADSEVDEEAQQHYKAQAQLARLKPLFEYRLERAKAIAQLQALQQALAQAVANVEAASEAYAEADSEVATARPSLYATSIASTASNYTVRSISRSLMTRILYSSRIYSRTAGNSSTTTFETFRTSDSNWAQLRSLSIRNVSHVAFLRLPIDSASVDRADTYATPDAIPIL